MEAGRSLAALPAAAASGDGSSGWSRPLDWDYSARQYRPRKAILDGTWKFPEAQPAR